jgi:kinetochore protein Mis13/DSN1
MGYPHQNISETDFYKHISAEMPEPSRMRILLSWLLQRCIEFQVSTQKEELEVSKKIQKIALEALNKHEVDTFWLRRPLFPGEEDRPYNLNPQNEENIIKKRQLQTANAK